MILFMGCQGAGKTTFYRERFFNSHVRVSLDMLRTRHRERLLVSACLHMKQRFVVDNTNPTARDRERYIGLAHGSGFKVIGYYFEATIEELLHRNAKREGNEKIPEIGVRATLKKLEKPGYSEGFDELFRVRVLAGGEYELARMRNEEVRQR